MNKLYELDSLDFHYQIGKEEIHAIQNLSLNLDRGSFTCFFGPSGSGKTTLLNLMGLIDIPQKGILRFDGRNISTLSEKEKNAIRRKELGFVFQSFHLFPVLTAEENVEFFLARAGIPKSERIVRIEKALSEVGLLDQRKQKPLEMSGGQRQRVAIARALAKQPKVLIADEPTANLDQDTSHKIMEIFQKLHREQGLTLVMSSHDPMVQSFAKQKICIKDGRIAAEMQS
jgi:ABC-type lipoprotein export system ATPase subunit